MDLWNNKENRWLEGDKGSYHVKMPVSADKDSLVKALKMLLFKCEQDILSGHHEKIVEGLSDIGMGGSDPVS